MLRGERNGPRNWKGLNMGESLQALPRRFSIEDVILVQTE